MSKDALASRSTTVPYRRTPSGERQTAGAAAILIVDDSPANLRLYSFLLRDLGAEIVVAGTGAETLQAAATRDFAMVLLDVNLQDMIGFEVARRLRADRPGGHVPIVFVSAAFTREGDQFEGYEAGAVDYLLSPIDPEILRAKARVFLDQYRLRQELQARVAQLEQVTRALRVACGEMDAFTRAVTQDLEVPLGHISGFAETLLEEQATALDAEGRANLRDIARCVQRMEMLVGDLFNLRQADFTTPQRSRIDLTALAEEVLALIGRSPTAQPIDCRIQPGLHAEGDGAMLRILLSHLLDHAWKTCLGLKHPFIEFVREAVATEAAFVLRFGSLPPSGGSEEVTDAAAPGLYLGLATVRKIVAHHGGRIRLDSPRPGVNAIRFCLGGSG